MEKFVVPLFITVIIFYALLKKTSVYDGFCDGVQGGAKTLFRIFPPLLAIMVSVSMLKSSGAIEGLLGIISPAAKYAGISDSTVLLGLLRPLSGSGALGILGDILKSRGADSFDGLAASVMMGSTETTFYTLSVYFSKTGVKYKKMVLPAAIFGDIVGLLGSIAVCKIFF